MSSQESQALKSLQVVLDHALARLNELEGKDRMAFAIEYKEWLADDELKEKVWFSIPLKKIPGTNQDWPIKSFQEELTKLDTVKP